MADVVVVIHPHAYEHAFKSTGGMVGAFITDITKDVEAVAKFEAPGPGKPPRNRSGISYGKGRLQSSMNHDVGLGATGDVEGIVYTRVPYAKYVIKGTSPHVIKPKNPGGVLKFFWWKKGRRVAFKHVNHPGTAPNNFLGRALKKGCAVHGIH